MADQPPKTEEASAGQEGSRQKPPPSLDEGKPETSADGGGTSEID